MNNKALTLSLGLGIFGVMMVSSYVTSIEESAQKKFGDEVLVVKTSRDIKEQETIDETMIKLEKVPSKFREPGTIEFDTKISEEEGKKGMQPLIGAVALVALKSGEQVTFNKITEPSARTGLSPQVSPGMRAVSIPVTETSGVGKLIKPNDRVDLIGVIDGGGGKENKVSRTLIQDVVVLAVGKYITNNVPRIVEIDGKKQKVRSIAEDVSFNSITIEVEPDQAQRIALILSNPENSISFSLRNNDDNARVQIPPSNVSDILGGDVTRSLRGLQQGGRK